MLLFLHFFRSVLVRNLAFLSSLTDSHDVGLLVVPKEKLCFKLFVVKSIDLHTISPGLYIRAGSRRSLPASLQGFATTFITSRVKIWQGDDVYLV